MRGEEKKMTTAKEKRIRQEEEKAEEAITHSICR
jgi:hypothetical protein